MFQNLSDFYRRRGLVGSIKKILAFPARRLRERNYMKNGISLPTPEERFTWIYDNKYWGSKETLSGGGSRLEHTENLRARLPEVFRQFNIKTLLDLPCGDFNWMKHVVRATDITYIGADIVKSLVERLQAEYGNARISFHHLDLTRDPLPKADALICRDCLFHLSYEDTRAGLENFVRSGIPLLLTTSHQNTGFANRNIRTGDFREMDLLSEPYNFPQPVLAIDDWARPKRPKFMLLFRREQVVQALESGQLPR